MTRLLPVLADAALVLLFAFLGRRSHEHGLSLSGLFLCGTAAGWLLAAGLTDLAPRSVPFGLVVVAATVVVGMGLRLVFAQGVAWSFVLVATAVLSVLLLGWRAIAGLVGA